MSSQAAVSPAPTHVRGNYHTVIWQSPQYIGMDAIPAESVGDAKSAFTLVNPHCKVIAAFKGVPSDGTHQSVGRFAIIMRNTWQFHSAQSGYMEWYRDTPQWVIDLSDWFTT